MNKINTILVIVDPTVKRDYVIDRAKLIAKAAGARVNLFVNNPNSLDPKSFQYEGIDPEFFQKQRNLFLDHHKKILEDIAGEFATDNIRSTSTFEEKHNLAEAIIEQAQQVNADLVIKSTHHHSLVERALITNTDWRLIRKCQTPLLLVKPTPWTENGCLVTAVDPMHAKAEQSQLDELLLKSTAFLAGALQQEFHVFHSYFPFVSTLFATGPEITASMERIRTQHEFKLTQLLAHHNITPGNIKLSRGELVSRLINYLTAANANILVIGALSRNVLERAIVGDTAEKILEDCPCDVLVLKSAR